MKNPEERFIELIGEYSINIVINGQYKNFEFFNSKKQWIIDYNQVQLTNIHYDRIWSIFEKEYNMSFYEIKIFIKDMLFKYFKIKNIVLKTIYPWVGESIILKK